MCKRLWLEFSLILNQFQTVCPKLEAKCLGKLGNSKLFSAQSCLISKNKRSSPKIKVILRPKSVIQRFFLPKIRWSPNKKKRSSPFFCPKLGDLQTKKKKKKGLRQNWGCYFVQFRKFRRLRGGCFRMGGLFSIFHIKSASKAQKACDFAHFTSQWGGSSPPPGYATDYNDNVKLSLIIIQITPSRTLNYGKVCLTPV